MSNYKDVQELYSNCHGSDVLYKRSYSNSLSYTLGVRLFQEKLQAYWLVDTLLSYMPVINKVFNDTQDTFYVVSVSVNPNYSGIFEIYREGYVDNDYNEHITILKQDISYIDLPLNPDAEDDTRYKFYLILSSENPIQYTLLLPSEY